MPRLFRFDCRSVLKPRDPSELSMRYELPGRHLRHRSHSPSEESRGDGRFLNYLASGLKNDHSRRKTPTVERNKLIVVTVFVGLILFAIVYQILVG